MRFFIRLLMLCLLPMASWAQSPLLVNGTELIGIRDAGTISGAFEVKTKRLIGADLYLKMPIPPGEWQVRHIDKTTSIQPVRFTNGNILRQEQVEELAIVLDQVANQRVVASLWLRVSPTYDFSWSGSMHCSGPLLRASQSLAVFDFCHSLDPAAVLTNHSTDLEAAVRRKRTSNDVGWSTEIVKFSGFTSRRAGYTVYYDLTIDPNQFGLRADSSPGYKEKLIAEVARGFKSGELKVASDWFLGYAGGINRAVSGKDDSATSLLQPDAPFFPVITNLMRTFLAQRALADGDFRPDSSTTLNQAPKIDQSRLAASLTSPAAVRLPWKERLDRVVESELRDWLNVDASDLAEVPPPVYPAALSLKQEAWETNKEFEGRVEAARNERRRAIERLEADYRAKAEQRNKRVAEYNKARQEREAGLVKRRQELIRAGIEILPPAVKLSDVTLDQQLGVLTISAEIDGLGRQVFAFKDAPQAFRRSAVTETSLMKPSAKFQVSQTGEISIEALSVQAGGLLVRGVPSSATASPVQLASVTLPAQPPTVVQQSVVSVDTNQVEQILYRDENEMLRRRLEEQRRQQEASLAAAEARLSQEIARNRAEGQRAGAEVVRGTQVQEAHALVIGNSEYRGSGRLENPVRDAQAMSAKLRALGFRVTELKDTNRDQLVKGLSEFARTAAKADLTLLFYAGHGMQVQGVNYMIPIDMSLSDPGQASLQAVPLTQVLEQYLPGKTKLVFLDACRDNPLITAGVRGASRGLASMNVSEGTLIAYATKDGQVAADGVGSKNSPFTQALLEHLADPSDISVVLRRVREKVMQVTGGKQQPWDYGSLTGGELVLSKIRGARP